MDFLNRMPLRTKLMIAAIIPIIGLLYYLQSNVRGELEKKKSAENVVENVAEVNDVSRLIHEIQKERALSASFFANEQQLRAQLAQQREATDAAVSALRKNLNEKGRTTISAVDSISRVRARLDAGAKTEVIDPFYYGLKEMLLERIAVILSETDEASIKNHFEAHLFLLNAKDFLAQMRTQLSKAMEPGRLDKAAYGNFVSLKGKHEFNLQKFAGTAPAKLEAGFNNTYQGPFVTETYAIIDSVYANPSFIGPGFDFNRWWSVSTSSINTLKEVEDLSGDIVSEQASRASAEANAKVFRDLIIAALILLLSVLIVFYTIKTIVESVGKVREAANRMTRGEVNVQLDVKSKDEIGALAGSFNQMIQTTKDFAEVADSIGMGKYETEVKIRGNNDTLGIALEKMKENLQRLSRENEIRTWLLTGNSEMNNMLRGEKDVKLLARDVATQLSTYLDAQVAALYLKSNGSYILAGSYAYHHRKDNITSFREGESLVGQAALEKKPITFRDIPGDYLRIQSGLGHAAAKNILVYPFLYDNEVKGIVEIATAREIRELDMELMDLVSENIAIAFHAAQSRSQLKELLEETQRQAEELEAQQEELKQSNEELLEKTGLLEKSESELKVQQEELQQTNEELEEKANLLEEQKEKLEHAKMDIENKARELEVTSRYKSEFLANMSHELRTPLNSVLILAQLLAENKSKVLGQKEVDFARTIYNSGTDLLMLINEILDLSKVESGKMELDVEKIAISEVETDMQSMFSELAKNKGIDFRIETDLSVQNIYTDKQRLEQILRNLLSNAFKFTEAGGTVTLSVKKQTGPIHFKNKKLHDISEIIAFSITDTGIGIPVEKQSIIFEAFQQADGSTKRKYGGTGLGLSISRELANVLGGEIHLYSEAGKGSTFTLHIPTRFDEAVITPIERVVEIKEQKPPVRSNGNGQQQQAGKVPEANDDRYQINGSDKLILIMEDDEQYAKILLDFVRERHYKAIVAHEGTTGLSFARHYKPDAIILDMKMPVMDGTEVLKQLKSDPELRHIPVQIISGYDKRKEGMELGAFDFIQKPISQKDLQGAFEKIERFISKKLKKLLIVEDDRQQNKAICELIGDGDVKCISAFSGLEAYEKMKNESFECIIVDLGLPDMSGFELLEKLRSDNVLQNVPVIVYTARDLSREEVAQLNKLANTVVLKTVNSHERLLDETTLFLHRVESRLPKEKQKIIRQLHKTDEVLRTKKVLVVDDDIRNIYSLTNILEEEGVNCVTAENGKVALEALKQNPSIDMVLMDVMMPEMDGYEATREIRRTPKFAKLPIIALTAKAMKGDREKCLEAGMSDYISKPVNVEQLLSLMRVWLYR